MLLQRSICTLCRLHRVRSASHLGTELFTGTPRTETVLVPSCMQQSILRQLRMMMILQHTQDLIGLMNLFQWRLSEERKAVVFYMYTLNYVSPSLPSAISRCSCVLYAENIIMGTAHSKMQKRFKHVMQKYFAQRRPSVRPQKLRSQQKLRSSTSFMHIYSCKRLDGRMIRCGENSSMWISKCMQSICRSTEQSTSCTL
jgi:hypothetical protein